MFGSVKYIILMMALLIQWSLVFAKGDLLTQEPIKVVVTLEEYKFVPNRFEFETGKLYQLVIKNAGKLVHEFDSPVLATKVFTRKVAVLDSKGKVLAEIKGRPDEIEISPGQTVEWWFVPVSTDIGPQELICDIPGHLKAGMRGSILIK